MQYLVFIIFIGVLSVVFYLFLRKLFENGIKNEILPKQDIKQPSNVDRETINEIPEDCNKEIIEE